MNSQPADNQNKKERRRSLVTLCSILLVAVGLWGIVLPRIADLPAMREKLLQLDEKGIDPNAFFYSDHPAAFPEAGVN